MTTQTKSVGFMENLTNKLSEWLTPFAEKLQELKYVSALSETMMLLVPVVIIGSFATLFAFVDLLGWQDFLAAHPAIQPAMMSVGTVTLGMFGFYVLLVLPYTYAVQLGMREALTTIPLAVLTYLALTPVEIYTSIPTQWLGHTGLISAMLISYFVVRVVKFCLDKNIRVKMPAGVPRFVEDAFSVLVPSIFLAVFGALIQYLFSLTTVGSFHNLVYVILQTPFQKVGLSLVGHRFHRSFCIIGDVPGFACRHHSRHCSAIETYSKYSKS